MAVSSKATKVPVMRDDAHYSDWKKELMIWQKANIIRGVDKKVLAAELFESLQGKARATVLSELDIDVILHDDGIKNILAKLSEYFTGDKVHNSFQAHDELLKFRRDPSMSLEDYLIEFQLRMNKVKASGTVLDAGFLGYALLDCANMPEKRTELVRATCDTFDFKTVKQQLEKIGLGRSHVPKGDTTKFSAPSTSQQHFKVEDTYYGDQYSSDSSNDAQNETLYANDNRSRHHPSAQNQDTPLNPKDVFGNTQECKYCHCIYHRLYDCMYAPDDVKDQYASRRFRQKHRSGKPYGASKKNPL